MNVYAECYDSRKKPPVAEVDVPTWESASLTSSGTNDREEVKDSVLMLSDPHPKVSHLAEVERTLNIKNVTDWKEHGAATEPT
jgi:hypothetical protein